MTAPAGFKIWWDEENEIIRQIAPEGVHDLETAQFVIEKVFELFEKHPGAPLLVLGHDSNLLTKNSGELFRKHFLNEQISRVAFLDPNPIMEYDMSYLLNSFPEPELLLNKMGIFSSEEEAIAWLKS